MQHQNIISTLQQAFPPCVISARFSSPPLVCQHSHRPYDQVAHPPAFVSCIFHPSTSTVFVDITSTTYRPKYSLCSSKLGPLTTIFSATTVFMPSIMLPRPQTTIITLSCLSKPVLVPVVMVRNLRSSSIDDKRAIKERLSLGKLFFDFGFEISYRGRNFRICPRLVILDRHIYFVVLGSCRVRGRVPMTSEISLLRQECGSWN